MRSIGLDKEALVWCKGREDVIRVWVCGGCLYATNDHLREPCEYPYDERYEIIRYKPIS